MRFKIISTGNVIVAELAFVTARYPGDFLLVIESSTRKDDINARLAEIDTLGDKARTRREMLLAKVGTKTWLQALDDESVALRTELAGLP